MSAKCGGRFGLMRRALLAALLALLPAPASADPANGTDPHATLARLQARDRFAAPAGELAAWEAFALPLLADPAADPALRQAAALGLGIARFYAKDYEGALAMLDQAGAAAPVDRHAYRALVLTELGRLDEAGAQAQAAIVHATTTREQALAHNALASLAFARNDLASAERHFCAARDLGLSASPPDHPMIVNDAASCAVVKYYLERPDTLAAIRLASNHAHAHLPPDHPRMGNVLNTAYAVLLRYGRNGEAEPLIRRHLALERALHPGDADDVYDPLSMLARALELRGRYEEAEALFAAAAAMAGRLAGRSQPYLAGQARTNLARVVARQGRLEEAAAEARAGLARLEADLAPGDAHIGSGRLQLADQLDRLGRHDEALALAQAGLAVLQAALPAGHSQITQGHLLLARIMASTGEAQAALSQARDMAARFEAQLLDLATSETEQVTLSRLAGLAFGDYLEVALAAGAMSDAVRAAQLLLLSDLAVPNARIGAAAVARNQGLETELARLDAARAEVEALEAALARVLAEGAQGAAALSASLAHARDEAAAAEAALLAQAPDFAELSRPRPASLAQIQQRLEEGELLVLPLALPTRAITLVIGADQVLWGETAMAPHELGQLAARLRESAEVPGAFDHQAARALFELVFPERVRPALARAWHLLFPASGYLARVPPGLLLAGPPDPARPGQAPWLVRSHAVSVLPDPAAANAPARPASATAFLGVGAPIGLPPLLDGADVAALLPPLPRAEEELRALASAIAAPEALVLAGSAATLPSLLSQDLQRFSVIAFSTHGLAGGEVPGLAEPALLLSPAGAGDAEDGLLTASRIARLQLAADWVILSACNTATGEDAVAPSYSGLARAFARAGARSLLLSHWRVRDDIATFLSVVTLRAAVAGVPRAEALRRAQLALIDGQGPADAADPALWAPFVLVGH